MKKFLLGLLIGVTFQGALAATPPWEIPLYECKLGDGTRLGTIGIVKEGVHIVVNHQGIVLSWAELEKAKAVTDAIHAE